MPTALTKVEDVPAVKHLNHDAHRPILNTNATSATNPLAPQAREVVVDVVGDEDVEIVEGAGVGKKAVHHHHQHQIPHKGDLVEVDTETPGIAHPVHVVKPEKTAPTVKSAKEGVVAPKERSEKTVTTTTTTTTTKAPAGEDAKPVLKKNETTETVHAPDQDGKVAKKETSVPASKQKATGIAESEIQAPVAKKTVAVPEPEPVEPHNSVATKAQYADGENSMIVGKTKGGSLTTPGKIVGDLDKVVTDSAGNKHAL